MAVDRNGETVVAGQIYLVAGAVRRIDGNTVVIVLDSGQVVRTAAADVCKVDAALGGGTGVTDHGALTGLTPDDDHPQYVLANGTRAFTAPVAGVAAVGISDLTTRQYVDVQDLTVFNYHELTKQPLDATLTALAGLTTAAGKVTKWTGVDTCTTVTIGTFGETMLATATAAAAISALGLATVATSASAADLTSGTLPAGRMPALTGDITTSSGAVATTLANSGVSAATFKNATVTFDAKGRATSASSGDEVLCDAPIQAVTMSTVYEDLCSKVVTLAAGDIVEIEVSGTILNNSGVNRTYTFQAAFGLMTLEVVDGAVTTFHATNRTAFRVRAIAAIKTSSSAAAMMETQRCIPVAANTGSSGSANTYRHGWQTSGSDITGANTIELRAKSDSSTATQTLTVNTWRITKMPQRL